MQFCFHFLGRVRSIWVVATMLGGCFTSAPPGNLDFAEIGQLSDLDGVYRNLGEAPSLQLRLSELVWPDAEDLDHAAIERIDVRAVDAETLAVTATDKGGAVIRRENFVEGEDFKIRDGAIQLRKRMVGTPADAEAAAHFLGMGYEDVDLGLDQAGHGKYRSKGMVAGTVFIFIPIAAGGSDEVRFRRLSD